MTDEEKKAIRYEFLKDWIETATKEEIIEKLIQNDDRAKIIAKQQKELEELKEKYIKKDFECRHLMELIKSSSNVEYLEKEN